MLLLALRILHIAGGIVWVGAVVAAVFFIEPAASDLGHDGDRFLAHLVGRRRLTDAMAIAAGTAIVAGLGLYWIDSSGLSNSWTTSRAGIAFAAGGVSAVLAFLIASVYLKPAFDRLGSGDPPPSHSASARLRRASLLQAASLGFRVITMAAARYL